MAKPTYGKPESRRAATRGRSDIANRQTERGGESLVQDDADGKKQKGRQPNLAAGQDVQTKECKECERECA